MSCILICNVLTLVWVTASLKIVRVGRYWLPDSALQPWPHALLTKANLVNSCVPEKIPGRKASLQNFQQGQTYIYCTRYYPETWRPKYVDKFWESKNLIRMCHFWSFNTFKILGEKLHVIKNFSFSWLPSNLASSSIHPFDPCVMTFFFKFIFWR